MSASNKEKNFYITMLSYNAYIDLSIYKGRREWMREWFEQPMTSDNVMEKQ